MYYPEEKLISVDGQVVRTLRYTDTARGMSVPPLVPARPITRISGIIRAVPGDQVWIVLGLSRKGSSGSFSGKSCG